MKLDLVQGTLLSPMGPQRSLDIPFAKGHHLRVFSPDPEDRHKALEIGRALATEPSFLLLDEPASGLNEVESERLKKLIRKIRESGITTLLVEHDMSLVVKEIFNNIKDLSKQETTILLVEQNARAALKIAIYVYVLGTGAMVTEGTPQNLLQNEKIKQAYLGG